MAGKVGKVVFYARYAPISNQANKAKTKDHLAFHAIRLFRVAIK